ncbi:MAG: DUF423 domain-containing protein [Verrucomicrobiota bacterium]
MSGNFARMAAVLAALGVVAGAMGAHALEDRLAAVDPKALEWWATASHHHLIGALTLFAAGLSGNGKFVKGWWTMLAGIVLFSGSLYLMALTGSKAKVVVLSTPLGGTMIIVGWILFAVACGRKTGSG